MTRHVCRATVMVALVVVAFAARATEPFPEDLSVRLYRFDLANLLGWGHNISRSQDVRPWVTADGKRLYMISSLGPPDAPWEVAATRGTPASFYRVTNNARNELAVVPSPVDGKLLLLVEGEVSPSLIVAHGNTDQAVVAEGLDAEHSQFDWSHDGAYAYYTLPAADGNGMALYRIEAGGNATRMRDTIEVLIEERVCGFDVCRTRDRVGVLVAGEVRVLDGGKEAHSIALQHEARDLRLSPDGRLAAWSDGTRVVVAEIETGKTVATSSPPEEQAVADRQPAWSPDGTRLVFQREYVRPDIENRVVQTQLVLLTVADGAEEALPLVDKVRRRIQWASTGDPIVFEELPIDSIGMLPLQAFPPSKLKPRPKGLTWRRANGPYGGNRIIAHAVAPSDDKVLYANVDRKGFFITTDGGEHWRKIEPQNLVHKDRVRHLAVDPADPKTVYAAPYIKIHRSTDGGARWQYYAAKTGSGYIDRLVAHPSESGVLFVLCDKKRRVARIDGGRWTDLIELDEDAAVEKLEVDERNPELVVLCDRSRVLMFSPDGGKTWHEPKMPEGEKALLHLAGSADDADLLLALTWARKAYFSTDLGRSWDVYADASEPTLWIEAIRKVVADAFPVLLHGEQGETVEGKGFERVDTSKQPRRRYSVRRSRIHRSDDGGRTWKPANKGLGLASVHAVQPLPDVAKGVVISSLSPLMRSTDGGESWEPIPLEDRHESVIHFAAHPTVPGLLFACDRSSWVLRSDDHGESWEPVLDKMDVGTGRVFEFDPDDADHITLYTGGGVFESSDAGKRWTKVAAYRSPHVSQLEHFFIIAANSEAITIGRRGLRRIFQSRDRGRTWRRLDGPFRGHRLVALMGRPGAPGALYVLTNEAQSDVLWVSGDFGKTWEARPLPASLHRAYSMGRSPADPDMLAVGIGDQIWLSRDDGRTWQDLGGFPVKRPFSQLAFSPADGRLYVVILWDGVAWTTLPAEE